MPRSSMATTARNYGWRVTTARSIKPTRPPDWRVTPRGMWLFPAQPKARTEVARYDGPAHDGDAPMALALDSQQNVYVAGPSKGSGTDYDYAVVKYFQPQPPVIVTQPASQNVQAATTVVFSVVAQGTAPLL